MPKRLTDNVFFRAIVNAFIYCSIVVVYFLSRNDYKWESHFMLPVQAIVLSSILVTFLSELATATPRANLTLTNLSGSPKAWLLVQKIFWKITDIVHGFFWLLFDSWRKPNIELFVRLSQPECIIHLYQASQQQVAEIKNEPITGLISGTHFTFYKWSPPPPFKIASIPGFILTGVLKTTLKGTYVRAWQRTSNYWVCFGIFIPTVISGFIYAIISISLHIDTSTLFFWGVVAPPVMISVAILIVKISSTIRTESEQDLSAFLKTALKQKA